MKAHPIPLAVLLAAIAALLACGRSTPVVVPPVSPPEPGPASPTPPPLGSSRFQPAPAGSLIQIDDMTISITEVVYPADSAVREGSLLNPTPEPSMHYLFVRLSAACNRPPDSSCRLSGLEFSLVDPTGLAHNPRLLLAGVPGKFEGGEFFGGATKHGTLIFSVPGDEVDFLLKYEALFGGEAYLSLD